MFHVKHRISIIIFLLFKFKSGSNIVSRETSNSRYLNLG